MIVGDGRERRRSGHTGMVLTHLHHSRRVPSDRPARSSDADHGHHWGRDAVIAAQVGAAALIVVTALEAANRSSGDAAPVRGEQSEFVVENPATATVSGPGDQAPALSTPTDAGGLASSAPTPEPSVAAMAQQSGEGSIAISVVHGGDTVPAVEAIDGQILGPVEVKVLDGTGNTIASTTVGLGEVGRIEGLPAGSYRLVLTQESPVTEPSPGVGIGASSAQMTGSITIGVGDTLLISVQPNPAASAEEG